MLTSSEKLMLLLCGQFGDETVQLGLRQFREISDFFRGSLLFSPSLLMDKDQLVAMGFSQELSSQIFSLISRESMVDSLLESYASQGIFPLTRISPDYPQSIIRKLGDAAPMVLFYSGDISLLRNKAVALVGSRNLSIAGAEFARAVGQAAARAGVTVISGGAEGADSIVQRAAIAAGGTVVCFRPESLVENVKKLSSHIKEGKLLVISERGAECPFSTAGAVSRNRLIHSSCDHVFVAGCTLNSGGTWTGTMANLKKGYSRVHVFNDGSAGCNALIHQGAEPVDIRQAGELINRLSLQPTFA